MTRFGRMKNRLIARILTRYPSLSRRFVEAYRPWESDEAIPWSVPRAPLSDCRVAVVTTAGVHHRRQPPFDMEDAQGDPTFRTLDGATIGADYRITHDYYDHADVEKDLNIVLPLERLGEMAAEGRIGRLAERHYSFMGHIDGRHIPALIGRSAPKVAELLEAEKVDVVLLTPA